MSRQLTSRIYRFAALTLTCSSLFLSAGVSAHKNSCKGNVNDYRTALKQNAAVQRACLKKNKLKESEQCTNLVGTLGNNLILDPAARNKVIAAHAIQTPNCMGGNCNAADKIKDVKRKFVMAMQCYEKRSQISKQFANSLLNHQACQKNQEKKPFAQLFIKGIRSEQPNHRTQIRLAKQRVENCRRDINWRP